MPSRDPAAYAWLTDPSLRFHVAGCVTVAAGTDPSVIATAFGAIGEATPERTGAGEFADFRGTGTAVLALEDNGFQGTRPAVLTSASKTAANGRAASICWNVEGEVTFICAAKGKLVTSLELEIIDDTDDVPRALQKLAALCENENADLVAIGAAMVATYTDVDFTAQDLTPPYTWRELEPPLDVLPATTIETTSMQYGLHWSSDPTISRVLHGIASLDPVRQRRLAEWVAAAAVSHGGLGDIADRFAPLVQGFGNASPPPVPAGLIVYLQKVEKLATKASMELATSDPRWFPYASMRWVGHVVRTGRAVRYACHADPATAAWESVHAAAMSFRVTETLRGAVVDSSLYPAALAFIEDPGMTWEAFTALLPSPSDPDELRAILAAEHHEFLREKQEYAEDWGDLGTYMGPIEPFRLPGDH